jgi:hypothetical protein
MAETFQDRVELVVGQCAPQRALAFFDGRLNALAQLRGDVLALLRGQKCLQLQQIVLD